MGRPRGSGKNTAMVNGRVTSEQMEWLLARAEELDGNLSAALRQTITDARFLESARKDFETYCDVHPDFELPSHEDGGTWAWAIYLTGRLMDSDDYELRKEERGERAD